MQFVSVNIPWSTILDAPTQLKYAQGTVLQCRRGMHTGSYLFSKINYKSFYIYIINSISIFIQIQKLTLLYSSPLDIPNAPTKTMKF
jgi:hypothetical protein